MGRAILASAAISGLVLPIELDGRIATDGGWVRNFPFDAAYRNPEVAAIAASSLRPELSADDVRLPRADARASRAIPRRSTRPGAARRGAARAGARVTRRACALRRADRPTHARRVRPKRGRRGAHRQRARHVRGRAPQAQGRRARSGCRRGTTLAAASLRAELEARFAAARFPFRHDRHVPAVIVRATSGDANLDASFKSGERLATRGQEGADRPRIRAHGRGARPDDLADVESKQ